MLCKGRLCLVMGNIDTLEAGIDQEHICLFIGHIGLITDSRVDALVCQSCRLFSSKVHLT